MSRTLRIMLFLAALAVAAYAWIELPRRRAADRAQEASTVLATFDPASVDAVVLRRPDGTLGFQRRADGWHMTAPIHDIAEPSCIEALLHEVHSAAINRHLGVQKNLGPFGLDRPAARVGLVARGDTIFEIALGKRTVDDRWCYARTRTRDVLLIPTDVQQAATLPRDAYRSRKVIAFQREDVGAWRMSDEHQDMTWRRGDHGWYHVPDKGDTIAGDSVAVEMVLRRLRALRIASFVDASDSTDNGATYRAAIRLTAPDGQPLGAVAFAHMPDGTWRSRDPAGLHHGVVDDDISDLFQHTATELRDRRLLQFSPPDAERIELASATVSGAIVRRGGRWSFPNATLGRVDAARAADFVRALRSLKWTAPVEKPHSIDRASATFRISVQRAGGTILDELSAEARPGEPQWYVTSRSSRAVWRIDSTLLTALGDRFAGLKQK